MKCFLLILSFCMLISCNEERGVVSELKECDSTKDANCQNTGNLENDLIIRVEGEEDKVDPLNVSTDSKSCKKGYVQVDKFCVMKDEAVQANRYKIRTRSIISAEKICNDQGSNIHLINHGQWMTIAKKIEEQNLNFDIGKKNKFLGARELFLEKDKVIVNFVTGQAEWVAWNSKTVFMPSQCSHLEGSASKVNCLGSSLGSSKLDGIVYSTKPSPGAQIAMVRSGSLAKHGKALYHAYIGSEPAVNEYGVRCAYSL